MARLQLVCSLLFICLISCTASPRDLSSGRSRVLNCAKNSLGLAQIAYYNEGQLCSGIHIKQWIVLTIADCVFGRDVDRLVVGVTTDGSWLNPIQVQVANVTIHDKYRKGKPENNFAILNIYGRLEWDINPFEFTSHFVTYYEIFNKSIVTTVDKWILNDEEFSMDWKNLTLNKNDSLCGTCEFNNCYCGNYTDTNPEYYQRDIGTPLYYNYGQDNKKMILGLDTGTAQAIDRVFQEVYSIRDWVMDFIHFHPVPPEDNFPKNSGS